MTTFNQYGVVSCCWSAWMNQLPNTEGTCESDSFIIFKTHMNWTRGLRM